MSCRFDSQDCSRVSQLKRRVLLLLVDRGIECFPKSRYNKQENPSCATAWPEASVVAPGRKERSEPALGIMISYPITRPKYSAKAPIRYSVPGVLFDTSRSSNTTPFDCSRGDVAFVFRFVTPAGLAPTCHPGLIAPLPLSRRDSTSRQARQPLR